MNENVVILLTVLVAANVILIIAALTRAWMRRRRASQYEPPPRSAQSADAARLAAAARAYVPPAPAESVTPPGRLDELTGTLTSAEWNRILADEDARIHRYGRPATIVIVELDGLDRLVAALGQEAGDRILPAVADSLSRHAREADHVARLGPGRFGVLLPETGEVEAVNYVERVRQICELWLESGAIALRLAIGWASPAVDSNLGDAFVEAQERMFAELRRSARRDSDITPDGQPPAAVEGAPSPA